MRQPNLSRTTLLVAGLALTVAGCRGDAPSLAERLPGTYVAHETAATVTYVVRGDGTAALSAVTNLNEQVNASAAYTVAGDSAVVTLTPEGGGAPRTLSWTIRGDSLIELDAGKRTVYVRQPR